MGKFLLICLSLLMVGISQSSRADDFDHSHAQLTAVLAEHVEVSDDNLSSRVNYHSLAQQPGNLKSYLASLSGVSASQYQQWAAPQQLAFLINAYNAFTLELIIDNYDKFRSGDAESIRDLGGLFSGPWEKSFFSLLGERRTLDWLEHEKIRVDFDEPRIHAALVCAAISCPKLRAKAFAGPQLEAQLEDQMVTFLSDEEKNGIDQQGIYLSKIFSWYRDDFGNLKSYLGNYAKALADSPQQRERVKQQRADIRFVDYNWRLNKVTQQWREKSAR
ncbi:DUF547 domain-containing protein [Idiomarina seosinensis]|uniref:DUF547 domain-containing protein n=1 Tax=Idiomarina seosinensis TaxID=281739 RepID=UPI00384ECE55